MSHASDKIEIATLPSGLKVVVRQRKNAKVDYCGVVVKVGSRDDAPTEPGMAHFVEHTIFKGTQRRSSWHIINRMERVGGELNAYTSKEETVVYTAAPAGNLARSIELIADLVANSRFPDSELNKEREVVADEINSYLDTPSEAVYDDFEELLFADTSLGHNILGNIEALSTFNSINCRNYLSKWYVANNMTLFYSGKQSLNTVVRLVEKFFGVLKSGVLSRESEVNIDKLRNNVFNQKRKIATHQCHTVMGCVTPNMYSELKYPLSLLTNILAGPGMNSLLNVQLREKRGLVYSVEASNTWLTDCGIFNIYFGCDQADNDKCIALIREQIEDLASKGITPVKLAQAQKQYLGQLTVASDNYENQAIATGRAAMYFDKILDTSEIKEKILNISPTQIQEAASIIADLSVLTFE